MTERIETNGVGLASDMEACGFPSVFIKGCESPSGDTYFFDLVNPLDYDKAKLIKAIEKLSVAHRVKMQFRPTKETHYSIFVENVDTPFLSLNKCLDEVGCKEFIIGKTDTGKNLTLDLETIPHMLIAGTTGSGKSILLHNILVNLFVKYASVGKKFELVIIDPKGSEFREYKQTGCHFVEETDLAIAMIKGCEKEMDSRYKMVNPRSKHDIYIVIDELSDLMITSKNEVELSIKRIAQKGRACGMHLIIATQYPKADIFTPHIRANIPCRFCLRTSTRVESIVAIGKGGAEKLKGRGDCIFQNGIDEERIQVAYPEHMLEQRIFDDFNKRLPKG